MFRLVHGKDFDPEKLNKIYDFGKTAPETAVECLERYVKKYPLDTWGHIYLGELLITVDRLDEAQEHITEAVDLLDENRFYFENPEKRTKALHGIVRSQLRIYAFSNDPVSFLKLYAINKDVMPDMKDEALFYYNMLAGNRESTNVPVSYTRSQMVEYSEQRLLDNIRYKTVIGNGEDNTAVKSFFNSNENIKELLDKINEKLPNMEKKYNRGFYSNEYFFKCSECGKTMDGETCDYIRVITLAGTKKVIDMYPDTNTKGLEYEVIERKKEEVKSHSMIDRFNRRYGIQTA